MADDLDKQIAGLRKQIADIDRTMASGVERVESADTGSVSYRKYDDLRRERSRLAASLEGLLGSTTGGRRRTRQIVTTSRSGW
ncbi:phage head-tail joining protein [Methylobacterium sp. CM6244]